MKIVCATDFSKSSDNALDTAVALARRLDDDLDVLHVILPVPLLPNDVAISDDISPARQASSERAIDALTAKTGYARTKTTVLIGNPAEAASRHASDLAARMVVMGTHGRSAAARFFLGSVAERAVRLAETPILVVPESAGDTLVRKLAARERLSLMAGLDGSRNDETLIAWIGNLRKTLPCNVTFVHLYWPPRERERLGLHPETEPRADQEIQAIFERDLWTKVGSLPGEGEVHLRVRANWGQESDPLIWEAELIAADIIILGIHHHRGAGGSTAIATLRNLRLPLLLIPSGPLPPATADVQPVRRVLVATDFSDLGNHAVTQAFRLVRAAGGVIDLVHVMDFPQGNRSGEDVGSNEKRLNALIPPRAQNHGIVVRPRVIEDKDPARAIVQMAERDGVDIVVIGTHGRTGLDKILHGSVAAAVLHASTKPVLLVRRIPGDDG